MRRAASPARMVRLRMSGVDTQARAASRSPTDTLRTESRQRAAVRGVLMFEWRGVEPGEEESRARTDGARHAHGADFSAEQARLAHFPLCCRVKFRRDEHNLGTG